MLTALVRMVDAGRVERARVQRAGLVLDVVAAGVEPSQTAAKIWLQSRIPPV